MLMIFCFNKTTKQNGVFPINYLPLFKLGSNGLVVRHWNKGPKISGIDLYGCKISIVL